VISNILSFSQKNIVLTLVFFDKQQEIFDDKITDLFSSILGTANNLEVIMHTPNLEYDARNKLDYRRTRLAALVVKV